MKIDDNKAVRDVSNKIRALVIGHTGATGSALLDTLIASPNCDSIIAIGRRESSRHAGSPKLTQYIVDDMLEISSLNPEIARGSNAAFCCIGTTFNDVFKRSKSAEYKSVDFGIATAFSKFSKQSNVDFFGIITGERSDSKSRYHMTRVKGETEDFVVAQNFNRVAILRPGLLNRGKGRRGWLEQIFTVGGIFGIPVSDLADGLYSMALTQTDRVVKYETKDIKKKINYYQQNIKNN